MSYLDQQFDLRDTIADLSPAVKQAMGEIDVVSEVWEIGDQFKLLVSEIGDICEETKKVIVGETRPESFVDNIRGKLGDENKNKATAVATEINNKVLIPIREAFKRISMGNLVPNPSAEVQPPRIEVEPPEPPTSYKLAASGYPDRNALMQEIENPTPAEISTIPFSSAGVSGAVKAPPPPNLPTEPRSPAEEAILRTMPRDMASRGQLTTNNLQPATESAGKERQAPYPKADSSRLAASSYSRGKFGHGTPPTLGRLTTNNQQPTTGNRETPISLENQSIQKASGSSAPSFIPQKPGSVGGTIKGENLSPAANHSSLITERRGSTPPASYSAPIPNAPTSSAPAETQHTTFQAPPKTETIKDVVDDKLTKTVNVPSERKRYVVDPYREPLE
jgi:hypothetical protein